MKTARTQKHTKSCKNVIDIFDTFEFLTDTSHCGKQCQNLDRKHCGFRINSLSLTDCAH